MDQKRLRKLDVVVERFGVTMARAYALVREGLLPPGVVVRIGRQVRIDPDALDQFIAAGGSGLPGGWRRQPADDRQEAL